MNRSETGASSTRPNVAAVGLPADDGGTIPPSADTGPVDPMGDVDARYLRPADLPVVGAGTATIAVGTSPDVLVAVAKATYRSGVGWHTCVYSGVEAGSTVRVVNVDNDRSIECTTRLRPIDQPQDELVMTSEQFAEIADLTSAPIDVEIRR